VRRGEITWTPHCRARGASALALGAAGTRCTNINNGCTQETPYLWEQIGGLQLLILPLQRFLQWQALLVVLPATDAVILWAMVVPLGPGRRFLLNFRGTDNRRCRVKTDSSRGLRRGSHTSTLWRRMNSEGPDIIAPNDDERRRLGGRGLRTRRCWLARCTAC
jgi:hypothetical protein